jgi:hypothetical protein
MRHARRIQVALADCQPLFRDETHVSNIYRKLGISSRMELALYAAGGKLAQPI